MKVSDLLRAFNMCYSAAISIAMAIMIWWAYLSGDWMVRVDFNAVGEGYFELVLFTLAMLNAVYFAALESNGEVTHRLSEKIEERRARVL